MKKMIINFYENVFFFSQKADLIGAKNNFECQKKIFIDADSKCEGHAPLL